MQLIIDLLSDSLAVAVAGISQKQYIYCTISEKYSGTCAWASKLKHTGYKSKKNPCQAEIKNNPKVVCI